jgi:osmotically-inducible protein OsmY
MRCTRLFLAAALLGVAACKNGAFDREQSTEDQEPTAANPTDQSNARQDIKITAEIRKRILAEPDLSTAADNAKIITKAGTVTLRGAVRSQSEKDAIERIATAVPGVTRVDNQLEIRP